MALELIVNDGEALRQQLEPWRRIRSRSKGRSKADKESYCLRKYLLALHTRGAIGYPVKIRSSETPDFIVEYGASGLFGIEVTDATDPSDQREMTLAARSNEKMYFEGQFGGHGPFVGDRPEELWKGYLRGAITRKSKLRYCVPRVNLVIYCNSNAGAHVGAGVAAGLLRELVNLPELGRFADVSVIRNNSVYLDIGNSMKFIERIE